MSTVLQGSAALPAMPEYWSSFLTPYIVMQKARKTFNLHLLNASKHAATTLDTASLALAFASAEVKRKAENYQAIAMHVLCWLAWGHGSFEPFDPAAVQMPHQRECDPFCTN